MPSASRAELLLAGPRGRRLCWAAVEEQSFARTGRNQLFRAEVDGGVERIRATLRRVLADTDLSLLSGWTDEITLVHLVASSVDSASYYQDPDELDRALTDEAVVHTLLPVADAIGGAPASAWWADGAALDGQVLVDWQTDEVPYHRFPGDAAVVLSEWKKRVVENEVRLRREHVSSEWWSPPIWALTTEEAKRWGTERPELHHSTRSLPGLGAIGLVLGEDRFGAASARCWPVRCVHPASVFEIRDAEDWRSLAERYPIEVTYGRRGNWRIATGLDTRWMLPDWERVAEEYDAVHLSLLGYLATSGRALQLGTGAATLVAGWNPDATYWLTDALTSAGEPTDWVNPEHDRDWRPIRQSDPQLEAGLPLPDDRRPA